jgi:hypothetical protein
MKRTSSEVLSLPYSGDCRSMDLSRIIGFLGVLLAHQDRRSSTFLSHGERLQAAFACTASVMQPPDSR